MRNQYETVFIVTPVLSEAQMKETVLKFKELLIKGGATIISEEHWGLKKLAYPIQKKSTGFYNLFEFEAEGSLLADFETEMKRDERLLRFLTVKLDKHAIEYAIKRRQRYGEKAAVKKEMAPVEESPAEETKEQGEK